MDKVLRPKRADWHRSAAAVDRERADAVELNAND
jgi:hypothetical protein